ncbi:MAG: glycosyltransferase [Anaerolineae bacterium]|nr:glycosyltransferase [Anaerolineae bacterium]
MKKTRVVYWNNMPSPYVVERFNALVRRGNIELEAWFNVEREPDRSWKVDAATWLFKARYIPQRTVFGVPLHLPLAELREVQPDVLVSLYYEPAFALGSTAARTWASRITYRVLPNYDTWSERTWWRELSKHFLFRAIDGAKVPGPDGAALAQKYGLPADRIHAVTQSINVAHYQRARQLSPQSREERRTQLGLKGCVFVYVGRLWSGKGLDYLLEAYRTLSTKRDDISLLLVGDGQDDARYHAEARDLPGVVFTGFIQGDELPEYYALSDVMVFPTLGDPHGLVVEEAMAAGLPVICTQSAGDIQTRLPENQAGYIVPPADAVTLAARMEQLAADPALRAQFAAQTLSIVAAQDHDAYARDFEAFIDQIQSTPTRRTFASYTARALSGMLRLGMSQSTWESAPYVQPMADYASS